MEFHPISKTGQPYDPDVSLLVVIPKAIKSEAIKSENNSSVSPHLLRNHSQ